MHFLDHSIFLNFEKNRCIFRFLGILNNFPGFLWIFWDSRETKNCSKKEKSPKILQNPRKLRSTQNFQTSLWNLFSIFQKIILSQKKLQFFSRKSWIFIYTPVPFLTVRFPISVKNVLTQNFFSQKRHRLKKGTGVYHKISESFEKSKKFW